MNNSGKQIGECGDGLITRMLEALALHGQRVGGWVLAHTKKDTQVILLILVLALCLRVPFLSYPGRTVFDEVIYTNFVTHMMNGVPFFDIHPPLARILFTEVAKITPFHILGLPMETNQSFGDFPYASLRFLVALFGILLVLLVYVAGRIIGYLPRIAAIPALLVVFDNAFVLYSRTILPDTILLCFSLLGFIAALLAAKRKVGWRKWLLVLLAASSLGLAVSIKWTALGIFGVVVAMFLLSRMYWEVLASATLLIGIYLLIFVGFFLYFPQGGKVDFMLSPYDVPWITNLEFLKNPGGQEPQILASFLVSYHRVMLEANQDPRVAQKTLQAPGPLSWPPAKSSISFWQNETKNKLIVLTGNSLLWSITFFALLFEIAWIAFRTLHERLWPIDRPESILLLGYVMNYLPFFFIHRPMFLYHYFTALLFLFLLVPRIAPRIIDCIARLSGDRLLANTLVSFVGFLILLNFFLLAPITYGF